MAFALVTGASGGLGAVFADRLVRRLDLLLVARSADRLEERRAALAAAHPERDIRVHVADLATEEGVRSVIERIAADGLEVSMLVNNAGSARHGAIADEDPELLAHLIRLDVEAPVLLARAVLPDMIAKRRGAIVNVGSTASFQPVPQLATYAAAKAFVLSWSEALHQEVSGTGIRVLALCPGPTETGFFAAAGRDFLTTGRQTPEEVVDAALTALGRGRAVVVPGLMNKVGAFGSRLAPRALVTRGAAWIARER